MHKKEYSSFLWTLFLTSPEQQAKTDGWVFNSHSSVHSSLHDCVLYNLLEPPTNNLDDNGILLFPFPASAPVADVVGG